VPSAVNRRSGHQAQNRVCPSILAGTNALTSTAVILAIAAVAGQQSLVHRRRTRAGCSPVPRVPNNQNWDVA
jgi:hypothetical protein